MSDTPFASHQIGDYRVTALSDGHMAASLDLLSGIDTADADEIQRNAGISQPGNIHINCYLIRGRGRTILVDAGTGGLNNAGGSLIDNLYAAGSSPEEIDTILLTHAHPDHIGGLLDTEGRATFANAELYIHPLEVKFWRNDTFQNQASERGKRNFELARRTLDVYGPRVNFLSESAIVAGIRPVSLPGHTPGHTGFRIDSGDKSLLIWGDIVHYPHIQSAQPAVSIAFDFDPTQAQASRKKILELAAQEKWLIAGMHFGKPGFAHIIPDADGYRIAYAEK